LPTVLGCGLYLAVAAPVRAEPPTDAAAAEVLFERGRSAAQRGDHVAACRAFAESQRLDPGAGTLMNWAMCEMQQHQVASAWQHLNEAAALLKPGDDRIAFVRAQIRKLSPRLSRLTVRLAQGAPEHARVLRSGTEVGAASLGVPVLVDAGEIELRVVCPGRRERRTRVTVREAEQVELTLDVGEELPQVGAVQRHEGAGSAPSLQRGLGFSFVALGTLSVGFGVASGFVVAGRQRTADEHCPAYQCDDAGVRAAESGQRWLVVNTLSWGVGAVALVGGGVLLAMPDQSRHAAVQALPGGAALTYAERY